jgi:uncharacterized protein YdaU (DUF1376 family)
MAQNRDAPAFQEYAASMMARFEYRCLSLSERGLLYSLRLECWANKLLPADTPTLARALGYEVHDIEMALPKVMTFFASDGKSIMCPELEHYRAHLEGRRDKLSAAGKKGAAKTNKKHAEPEAATPTTTPQQGRDPLVKQRQVKSNSIHAMKGEVHKEWTNEYERESNGA